MARSTRIPVVSETTLPLTARAVSEWQDRLIQQQMAFFRHRHRIGLRQRVYAILIAVAYLAFPFYGNWLLAKYQADAARAVNVRVGGDLR